MRRVVRLIVSLATAQARGVEADSIVLRDGGAARRQITAAGEVTNEIRRQIVR